MKNLWPKFKKMEDQSPKSIIYKQAEYLDAMNNGLKADVNSAQAYFNDMMLIGERIWMVHTFQIQASALEGFSFILFRAKHKTTEMYPVEVYDTLSAKTWSANSPKEFEEVLSAVFNSDETVEAIRNIISQIQKG